MKHEFILIIIIALQKSSWFLILSFSNFSSTSFYVSSRMRDEENNSERDRENNYTKIFNKTKKSIRSPELRE